jgi:amino acid transporter
LRKAAGIIVVSSVMFTFISYWRTAAVVLCDIASTVYYIGGIVENAIGPAAPWFILAVMLFSYAVRSVYIESCSLFVRGGVYRIVKEAMGGTLAKFSVSALMFDYILTGPISGVSAGQYIMGLLLQSIRLFLPQLPDTLGMTAEIEDEVKRWGAVLLAIGVTLYFYRQNLLGIHESSDKALKIMLAATLMAVIMIGWCAVTLIVNGPANDVPWQPDLAPKVQHAETKANNPDRYTAEEEKVWIADPARPDGVKPALDENGHALPKMNEAMHKVGIEMQDDPLGFFSFFPFADFLRALTVFGFMLAFGHSILAMSGEETLAQVYREVEAPKLLNFKRAALIVFVFTLVVTAGVSFLAVLLIPDEVRMKFYSENLLSGLARHVVGPTPLKLCLEAFVVVVGFLILSGAVNTSIIGSNGVLSRVTEDGVLPDWFLKPHPTYGTSYRILTLITGLQILVILFSRGDMIVLGEAYAFGVVWSFTSKALAMVVLRFKDPRPREYRVPFNITVGRTEFPIGLMAIFLVLFLVGVVNLFTKPVAAVAGLLFSAVFFVIFVLSERRHHARLQGEEHKHVEQFNQATQDQVSAPDMGLTKPYRKLVAIRSTQNLFMLEKALADTDPGITDVIVMTAKTTPKGESNMDAGELDAYDRELMTAVVQRAELSGKVVHPLVVPTNNPVYALLRTAKELQVHELVIGASNKFTADEQLDQVALLWINLHGGNTAPLTVRILSKDRDLHFDLGGGNRIPRAGESKARSVADLRNAGIGVDRVLLVQRDSRTGLDIFQSILTMLDPAVKLDILVMPPDAAPADALRVIEEQSKQVGRDVASKTLDGDLAAGILQQAKEAEHDLIILPLPEELDRTRPLPLPDWTREVLQSARCRVLLIANPVLPTELAE